MEIFDLYDERRRPTGETMVRGTPTPAGRYRLVVHVCIFNSKGEMLIQQRQPFKSTWANMWDITLGGAVTAGENTQLAAHRELMEELGLDVDFTHSAPTVSTSFRNGFDDLYILHLDPDIQQLKLQAEEVQSAKWASKEEILTMIGSGCFIPYSKAFIEYLFFRRTHHGNFNSDT